jgi:small-conductance mechanosensitive channel
VLDIFQLIESKIGISEITQLKLLKTVLILLILWGLRHILLKILWKQSDDVKTRYVWRKTTTHIMFFITLILIIMVWMSGLKSLGTYLGLLSAGIAIALKDPITNLFGWIFIVLRKPFIVGDRIEVGNVRGDVIDIRISQFVIIEIGNWVAADQSTGRIMYIPNNWIFHKPLANYTSGFEYIWNEIALTVTFESNWQKAKEILTKIINRESEIITTTATNEIKRASRKFMIYYRHLTPIVYMKINDFGVVFTLRYLANPRHRRGTEQQIWQEILEEFAKHHDIDFAYPTQRFYDNKTEGKPGTVPDTGKQKQ